MTDAVARIVIASIGTVGHEILTKFRQIGFHLCALHADQWADDIPPHRRNARKSIWPCTPRQMEQHGFQIVVRCMRSRNLHALRRRSKAVIPDAPRRSLYPFARRLCLRSDVDAFDG